MKSRGCLILVAVVAIVGACAPAAAADGLPVPVDFTFGEGVVSADGESRFVSLGMGDRTVVMRIATDGGEVVDDTTADGNFTIPAVAVDGTASGISADGGTLALINPRTTFPRRTTEFLIYEARGLRKPTRIELKGDFSFDALSPDGQTMYLVEYTDPRDPGAYQVRAFDLNTQELGDPILDSEEEPGEMRGFPQTRVTSLDGNWEYTLYDGGEHPFIHALNVAEATTVCIDVEVIKAKDTFGATLEMSEDDGSIELTDRKGALRAVVDTETFHASKPGEEPSPAAAPADDDGPDLMQAGLAAGGLLLVAFAAIGIRRMRN